MLDHGKSQFLVVKSPFLLVSASFQPTLNTRRDRGQRLGAPSEATGRTALGPFLGPWKTSGYWWAKGWLTVALDKSGRIV